MKPQFPTVQEQINYWNKIERLEHERVMDIRAESPNERNETGKVYSRCPECGCVFVAASNPQGQASDTALALDQTEATADWFDGLADTPYHLRDEGTVDGEGESYAARNL